MKRNVGTVDAIVRIAIGLFGLAWAVSRVASYPGRKFPKTIALFSALKAAEGITRFCPGLALFGMNTLDENERNEANDRSVSSMDMDAKKAPPAPPQQEEQTEPH